MTERAALEILITTELNKAKADLRDMHSSLKNIESAASSMGNVLKTALAIVGVNEILGGIKGLIASTAEWDRTAEQLTAQLNGNAVMATTWMAIAKLAGVENITLQRSFAHLSGEVMNNSAALRQMGIATVDSSGHFLSMGQIVNQIADYFHAHAGATNEVALITQLFARSGVELIPILEMGSAGIQKLSDQMRKYGYVVEAEALQRNSQFSAQLREGVIALEGLGMAAVHAAGPGLALLGRSLAAMVEQNLPRFIEMITKAVSFLVGFFGGLFGVKLEVSDTAKEVAKLASATGDYGTQTDKATGGASGFADAERKVREQTKSATDAIERQIKALEEQTSVENFQDAQRKLHQKLIDDNKKVDKDYSDYQNLILHGYEAAAMDQLVNLQSAQQSAADDSIEIDKGAKQEQRRTLIDQLREQEKQINDAADKQIAAMQRAASGMGAAISGVAGKIPGMFDKAKDGIVASMDAGSLAAGEKMGANLKHFNWEGLGAQIGAGILQGMNSAASHLLIKAIFGNAVDSKGNIDWRKLLSLDSIHKGWNAYDAVKDLLGNLQQPNSGFGRGIQAFAEGGVVRGPVGSPQLAVVHGGEVVSKGGSGITINVYGADSPERTAQLVAEKIGALMAA